MWLEIMENGKRNTQEEDIFVDKKCETISSISAATEETAYLCDPTINLHLC